MVRGLVIDLRSRGVPVDVTVTEADLRFASTSTADLTAPLSLTDDFFIPPDLLEQQDYLADSLGLGQGSVPLNTPPLFRTSAAAAATPSPLSPEDRIRALTKSIAEKVAQLSGMPNEDTVRGKGISSIIAEAVRDAGPIERLHQRTILRMEIGQMEVELATLLEEAGKFDEAAVILRSALEKFFLVSDYFSSMVEFSHSVDRTLRYSHELTFARAERQYGQLLMKVPESHFFPYSYLLNASVRFASIEREDVWEIDGIGITEFELNALRKNSLELALNAGAKLAVTGGIHLEGFEIRLQYAGILHRGERISESNIDLLIDLGLKTDLAAALLTAPR